MPQPAHQVHLLRVGLSLPGAGLRLDTWTAKEREKCSRLVSSIWCFDRKITCKKGQPCLRELLHQVQRQLLVQETFHRNLRAAPQAAVHFAVAPDADPLPELNRLRRIGLSLTPGGCQIGAGPYWLSSIECMF
jgi:hypothetical protein